VFTEDPPAAPLVTVSGGGGSFGTGTLGVVVAGAGQRAGAVVAASEFVTEGFRDHSWARRDLTNAKLVLDASPATRLTFIGNTQYQPETQDPLGLTRAQWSANPRGVDAAALQFDTRKTINQAQGGAALDHRFGDDLDLHVDAYGGRRMVRQYLAFPGAMPASAAGGVTDLDRDFGGVGARLVWRGQPLARPLVVTLGADTDRQHEVRRGFVNQNGQLGDLRRDEDDTVQSFDAYLQAEWLLAPRWSLTAGVRTSRVRYSSDDHYVTAQNPDDSGSQRFDDTSPVLGVVFHANDNLNLYASYGEGFETPTFAEIAYRQDGTGLNFALQPATSRAFEIGAKYGDERHRLTAAVFAIDTSNEIVVDAATGGRTTFKNAGSTRRRGAEASWDARYRYGLQTHVALTWLRAEFTDAFTTGAPPAVVPAGARLPGVPSKQAYAELAWVPGRWWGLDTALEAIYVDQLYVNDRNTDAAPSYAVMNARLGFSQVHGAATWRAFVRVNNLFDRNYAGSVIVGDTNGRFFEPAPGRNWFVGAGVDVRL
jgi:iron complex outermembrane recepter protein